MSPPWHLMQVHDRTDDLSKTRRKESQSDSSGSNQPYSYQTPSIPVRLTVYFVSNSRCNSRLNWATDRLVVPFGALI